MSPEDPIVASTIQAGVLAGISNVVAQYLASSKSGDPFTFDGTRFFQFVLYAVMVCPVNFIWQRWLEVKYPAYPEKLKGDTKEEYIDEFVKGQTQETKVQAGGQSADSKSKKVPNELGKREQTQSLNIPNTFIKFALDSSFGTAINTVMFIVGFALIRGSDQEFIQGEVAAQFWPMLMANFKVWPVVNIINYALVPLEYRMLVSQTVNLFWGVYLSLIASGTQKI